MADAQLQVVVRTKGQRDLERLKRQLEATGQEFEELKPAADRAANSIQKFGRTSGAASGKLGRFESKLASLGKVVKGGAIAGAIVGIGVAVVKVADDFAEAANELRRAEIVLRSITGADSGRAFEAIARSVEDFGLSTVNATQNFTKLAASVQGAGGNVSDVETVFRGLTAANTALGGSTEDLNGILLAATQVFSKGKVSAEELRGQIGERLPGAFTRFAEATGRSTQELDQALQNGEVSLSDFVKFAEKLLTDFEKDAEKLATGPENSKKRLENALRNLKTNVGIILKPLDKIFKDTFTNIVNYINNASLALAEFLQLGTAGKQKAFENESKALVDNVAEQKKIREQLASLGPAGGADSALSSRLAFLQRREKIVRGNLRRLALEIEQLAPRTGSGIVTGGLTDKPDPDPDPDKGPPKSLEALAGPDYANAARLKTQEALNENSQQRLEALKAGNDELVKELDTTRALIPLLIRQQAIADALEKLRGRRNELLEKGYTLEQITTGEKELQEALDLTSKQLAGEKLDIQNDLVEANKKEREEKEKTLKLAREGIKEELRRLEIGDEAFNREKERARLLKEGVTENEVDDYFKRVDQLKEAKEAAEELDQLFEGISQTIQTGIVDAISTGMDALIDGTKDFDEALKDIARGVLKDISRQLLGFAVNLAFKGSGGAGGLLGDLFRADGGPVTGGQSYIVGERGPELFTPSSSGMITSNEALSMASPTSASSGGDTIIVNNSINVESGTSSTSVQGSGDQAAARDLAKTMERVTLAVITREKRPGGSLAR